MENEIKKTILCPAVDERPVEDRLPDSVETKCSRCDKAILVSRENSGHEVTKLCMPCGLSDMTPEGQELFTKEEAMFAGTSPDQYPVQREWIGFARLVLPELVPGSLQYEEARRVFYAGAFTIFNELLATERDEDDFVAAASTTQEELAMFRDRVFANALRTMAASDE